MYHCLTQGCGNKDFTDNPRCPVCGRDSLLVDNQTANAYIALALAYPLALPRRAMGELPIKTVIDELLAQKIFQDRDQARAALMSLAVIGLMRADIAKETISFARMEKASVNANPQSNMPAEVLGDVYHLAAAMHLNPSFAGLLFAKEQGAIDKALTLFGPPLDRAPRTLVEPGRDEDRSDWTEVTAATHDSHRASYATKAVADAFHADPNACRFKLIDAWIARLSHEEATPVVRTIEAVLQRAGLSAPDSRLARWPPFATTPEPRPKVIVWCRLKGDHRSMSPQALVQICQALVEKSFIPIVVGDSPSTQALPIQLLKGSILCFEHWRQDCFAGPRSYQKQLLFFYDLFARCRAVAQVGVKSGAMDGLALMGVPTIYLESRYESTNENRNVRMENWHGRVPNFDRVQTEEFIHPHNPSQQMRENEVAAIMDLVEEATHLWKSLVGWRT